MTRPWNRRKTESDKAWTAFVTYRDLGATRSLPATVKAIGGGTGKLRVLEDWSSKHDWVARSAAWDAHLDSKRQKGYEESAEAIGRRQARLGRDLQSKAAKGLKSLAPESLDGSDVARLAKVGVELERIGAGLPTGRVAMEGPNGGPVAMEVVDPIASVMAADPAAREAALRLLDAVKKAKPAEGGKA